MHIYVPLNIYIISLNKKLKEQTRGFKFLSVLFSLWAL